MPAGAPELAAERGEQPLRSSISGSSGVPVKPTGSGSEKAAGFAAAASIAVEAGEVEGSAEPGAADLPSPRDGRKVCEIGRPRYDAPRAWRPPPLVEERMVSTRIEINPAIMGGKPVVRGTRIPVETILRELGAGMQIESVLEQHPRLVREDVYAALAFAADYLADDEVVFG